MVDAMLVDLQEEARREEEDGRKEEGRARAENEDPL